MAEFVLTLAPGEFPVVSAVVGGSDTMLAEICRLWMPPGSLAADVTYGHGTFWRKVPFEIQPGAAWDTLQPVDAESVRVLVSDLYPSRPETSASPFDCRELPYPDGFLDVLVLDPPYSGQGGANASGAISGYGNQVLGSRSVECVLDLYYEAVAEARRVLKTGGVIIIKTMDQIESGRFRCLHVRIINYLEHHDWLLEDLFVQVNPDRPLMRHQYQYHSRKNLSYYLVARKTR